MKKPRAANKPASRTDRGPATQAMRRLLRELTEAIRARRLGRIARIVAATTGNRISEQTVQKQLIGLLKIMLAGLEKNIIHEDPQIRRSSRATLKQFQQLVAGVRTVD